jgi:hypothetical protein
MQACMAGFSTHSGLHVGVGCKKMILHPTEDRGQKAVKTTDYDFAFVPKMLAKDFLH